MFPRADCDYISLETGAISQFEDQFVSPAVMMAHLKALDAYNCHSCENAAAGARAALALSPVCPEAYNVLALSEASSYEEALQLYRKAEELGPQVLQPQCFRDLVEEVTTWPRTPYRAFHRAMYGVANTLRKMARYQESLAAYDEMLRYDRNWYQRASYVNVMATIPLALLGAKGPQVPAVPCCSAAGLCRCCCCAFAVSARCWRCWQNGTTAAAHWSNLSCGCALIASLEAGNCSRLA
ncbi:hypothetical protein COO60DRAFT_797819 [Scenedesmus sp. NREL 46B-D3]|nr:hypothetical protein COO60DRAFT_797819 [Scenedesmus sp. NREL 46B-D3]